MVALEHQAMANCLHGSQVRQEGPLADLQKGQAGSEYDVSSWWP